MTTIAHPRRTLIDAPIEVAAVQTDDTMLWITLADGRVIGAPLTWFPRLASATPEQRANVAIWPAKTIVEWPDVDEHISAPVLLGHPS